MSVSSFFTEYSEDVPDDWTNLLHLNPLFESLREDGADVVKNANLMCEIRGDIFLWSPAKSAVLTTNLKRLKAHLSEDQSFQTLVCTATPLTAVSQLIPDDSGGHIALVSRQAISVMTIPRSRGEHGEFGGGQKTVNCRVTPIATDLFTIHHHTLHLLQAHWHPSLPHTLILLTSNSMVHLFSLADPNYARYSIPLSPSAASQVHGCTLQDTVVSFTCTRDNKLFALRDTGDVMVTQLSPPLQSVPTEPLPMHPMSEDNYGTDEATALLLLETTPLTLIIAHSSGNGTIYHCVYMESDKDGEDEDTLRTTSGSLYVVECLKLNLLGEDEPITLIKDPVLPYRYYISHIEGIHMVTIPWANRMDQFTTSSVDELVMRTDSDIQTLVDIEDPTVCSVYGSVIISEPLLGPSVVILNSDLHCQVLSLQAPPPSQFLTKFETAPNRPHPQVKPETGGFEKIIRDLLNSSEHSDAIVFPATSSTSQQECFNFFQRSVQNLRVKYLLPQQKAKAALQRRLDILGRQKEQQLRDLVAMRDDCAELTEKCEDFTWKMEEVQQKSSQLLNRMERLLCKLDAQSPILSDAEVSMEQELSQLPAKLQALHCRIEEAKGKLRLGYGETVASGERVKMSRTHDDSICSILEESAKRLLSLKLQVKSLIDVIPT